ncbi:MULTISPECIES: hypothetical protein [Streptomyces]|uniref:hypothetical protein n=1 Tax=Streptomyces TaxID=1883 RepID=UPI001CC24D64|nr:MULTISPECIES: hypothetical protein [Streptomyces]
MIGARADRPDRHRGQGTKNNAEHSGTHGGGDGAGGDERGVALVTGSSSGTGAAVARRLAAAGVRAVANSARSVEAGH